MRDAGSKVVLYPPEVKVKWNQYFTLKACEQRPESSAAVCSAARGDDGEAACHSDDSHVRTDACH